MLDRTSEQFDLTPSRLVADGGYGSADMVGWLVDERGIEPHVNLIDKSERTDGTFSRSDFAFDTERDLYVCPGGKELRKSRRAFSMPREGVAKDGAIRYRAAQHDCDACVLKPKCCPNMPARKIARSVHEAARDKARAIAKTEEFPPSHVANEKGRDALRSSQTHTQAGSIAPPWSKRSQRRFPQWPPPPKISGNWRSSFRSRPPSSPHDVESQESAALTALQIQRAGATTGGSFNKIDV